LKEKKKNISFSRTYFIALHVKKTMRFSFLL